MQSLSCAAFAPTALCSEKVRNQSILLAEVSPVISIVMLRKKLIVAGGIYELDAAIVTAVSVGIMHSDVVQPQRVVITPAYSEHKSTTPTVAKSSLRPF